MSKLSALGRHILIEFYDCNAEFMNDVDSIEKSMLEAASKAEATVINSTFHHFSPYGVSGVIVIQESHLAIHTWPEYKYAALDLFTCGNSINPWVSFDFLKKMFKASNYSAIEMLRGSLDQLDRIDFNLKGARTEVKKQIDKERFKRNVWFTDKDENQAISLRHSGDILYKKQSDYQKVSILNTYAYGKMLTIDNMVMCTERDEAHYHEMLTHPILLTCDKIKNVLVIGGGDGGTIRELFKHKQIEQVTMVEIDKLVIEASKLHLKTIATSFDNPKLNLIIGDGIDFVRKATDESYDLVIVDGSDPVGPAKGLFSTAFYENCYRILTPEGVLTTQSESPMFNENVMLELYHCFNKLFQDFSKVSLALFYAPSYPSGMWSFLSGFKHKNNLQLSPEKQEEITELCKGFNLKYYNAQIHNAALALPNFLVEKLKCSDV